MRKIIALVPARSGSIRIKHKNLQQIKGVPLLALAIRQALMSPSIQEVYVSTDSGLYADIAANYGACVPFIRPTEISGEFATDYEVFLHFLSWYQDTYKDLPELIVQIRPTAPVRESGTIENAIHFMLEQQGFDSLRTVSVPHQSPYKMWHMDDSYRLTPIITAEEEFFDRPTQSLPIALAQDGIVDIIRPETILIMHSMAGRKIAGLLDHPKTWDIDRAEDLHVVADLLGYSDLLRLLPVERAIGGNLGIMQGRLTAADELQCFPNILWEKEFEIARKIGYTAIELFRDQYYNFANPLWNTNCDVEYIRQIALSSGVGLRSICDDYVLQCCWGELTAEQYGVLMDLLVKAAQIGVSLVVYPLFVKADITTIEQQEAFLRYLKPLATIARLLGLKIALEITQDTETLCNLFNAIKEPNVGFCLDTGNLYAAGISPIEILEEKKLHSYLYHVHIKDRDSKFNNVIPGSGCVDFVSIFSALFKIGYSGTVVMETDRGENPIDTAIMNKKWFSNLALQGYAKLGGG
jgi:CMP-N,N'-diacetyllegionaminic acid synthase